MSRYITVTSKQARVSQKKCSLLGEGGDRIFWTGEGKESRTSIKKKRGRDLVIKRVVVEGRNRRITEEG